MATPERQELLDLIQSYRECFSSAAGQVVIGDLIKRFGFTRRSALVPGQPDKSAWNEGARCVLMHIGYLLDVNTSTLPDQPEQGDLDA